MLHSESLTDRNIDTPKIIRVEYEGKARFTNTILSIPTFKNRWNRLRPLLKIYVLILRGYKPPAFKTIFKMPGSILYLFFLMTDHDPISMLGSLI
ncbi:hypothetical protein C4J89_0834 [Pseudomonas sp. R4-35-07]|nr:hypothetical protein C4J89_0834 [Pseudomonas sp. R4-35-07]